MPGRDRLGLGLGLRLVGVKLRLAGLTFALIQDARGLAELGFIGGGCGLGEATSILIED
jgi:hypothetical protein